MVKYRGLLVYEPATGYDLKASFERSVYFFWKATLPQIYGRRKWSWSGATRFWPNLRGRGD